MLQSTYLFILALKKGIGESIDESEKDIMEDDVEVILFLYTEPNRSKSAILFCLIHHKRESL